MIISHIRPREDGQKPSLADIQTNEEHSLGVARLAEKFASEFDMGPWGYAMGILHDKGKEKKDFQNYIRRANGIEAPLFKDKSHSYVGALIAKKLWPNPFPAIPYAIYGHHGGLRDYNNMNDLEKGIPSEVSFPSEPLTLNMPSRMARIKNEEVHHLVRLLFSCLVDADFLDTEAFMQPGKASQRPTESSLRPLLEKLESYLIQLNENALDTEVNRLRRQVQQCCRKSAEDIPGVFSLSAPTGAGKTLSSLLWALLHAVKHGNKRIIIAIPYVTIISQTAALLKSIFGEENVLEHHSNMYNEEKDDSENIGQSLAIENWEAPIIVTTNVRLFESMYSGKPSACRRLHNIVNSVVILDEAQTLPGERLAPIISGLKTYVKLFGVSVLFTTASLPTLKGTIRGGEKDLQGFEKIKEIIPDSMELHKKLRRANLVFLDYDLTYEEIAQRMMEERQVLCIVNTRQDAGAIFDCLPEDDESCIHLSRMMCPEHVDTMIDKVKQRLRKNLPVRVISTQLVEAGVDIDFPCVMRQEAGLDSILQAAGRCNREGQLESRGHTLVFKIKDRNVPAGTMNYANQARLNMNPIEDLLSPEAIVEYFTQYYFKIRTFDKADNEGNTMESCLANPNELQFATASEAFRLIEDYEIGVVVNYGEAAVLIKEISIRPITRKLARRLRRFMVTLPIKTFKTLVSTGMVVPVANGNFWYVEDKTQYHSKAGLKPDSHWLNELLTI